MNAEKVSNHIINWLKDYAKKANVKGFVIGISGGIDSAVTSNLCAKTGLPVLCVEMPIHQEQNQISRAQEHIKKLKKCFNSVSSLQIDLSNTFDTFTHIVPSSSNLDKVNLSFANTRARLRMTTLYYLAGLYNSLVVGTGNKVEDFGVGFYTKYGDGGVDISPIADLMKSEVYALARYLGISEAIQTAAPTDGLFGDNRTDEDQIGASYDELEWAMRIQAVNKKIDDFSEREKEVYKIYTHLNGMNQHKMIPIPICKIAKRLKQI